MRRIAVVGYDEFTEEYLDGRMAGCADVEFMPALTREETLIRHAGYPFEERLELAVERVKEGDAAGVITYWDFPSSLLAPFIARRCGLPYASVESVMKCEHKFWFRREQEKVLETPGYAAFDPFAESPLNRITLDFPFWVKPVVGHSSMLGFEIGDRDDFGAALEEIREHITELTGSFAYPLQHCELPDDLLNWGSALCMAEELISQGEQYTLEGYVSHGKMTAYGVVASVRSENKHTFSRYQYPAALAPSVVERMAEMAQKLVTQLGYDGCPFNLEFFYDPAADHIHVLEMNSRLSQSHSHLFDKVDGQPHEQIAVQLAMGEDPEWRSGAGEFAVAAKFFVRRVEDGVVKAVPREKQLALLHEEMPDVIADLKVAKGQRLSELPEQETYSYELADLFIGAQNEDELLRKYGRAQEILHFDIEEVA